MKNISYVNLLEDTRGRRVKRILLSVECLFFWSGNKNVRCEIRHVFLFIFITISWNPKGKSFVCNYSSSLALLLWFLNVLMWLWWIWINYLEMDLILLSLLDFLNLSMIWGFQSHPKFLWTHKYLYYFKKSVDTFHHSILHSYQHEREWRHPNLFNLFVFSSITFDKL